MAGLFKAIRSAFDAKGWVYEQVAGREVLQSSFEAHHTRVPVHVQAFEPIGGVHVVATSPFEFESYHLLKASELLMRTSELLTVGNFEMLWEQRQVLFRAANLFERECQTFPDTILHSLVHAAVAEMDRITPLLAEIQKADPASVFTLDIPALMRREDWLPPVPNEPSA